MVDNDDFWDDLKSKHQTKMASSLEKHLRDNSIDKTEGLWRLTDRGRSKNALPLPVSPGTRVSFVANIGSVLQWKDPPEDGTEGTIVMVRTAEGDQTSFNGLAFVKFDDGRFLQVDPQFLRRVSTGSKRASNFTMRVSMGDLSSFLQSSTEDGVLVHKATKDLWSFEATENGEYVLSRLFDDTGEPIKV